MYQAVLTLLVGLMLSLGGGANALTFKSDGTTQAKYSNYETPSQLLEPVEPKDKLLIGKNVLGFGPKLKVEELQWNKCNLITHNLDFMVKICGLRGETRTNAINAFRNNFLNDFECGLEGKTRYVNGLPRSQISDKL